MNPWVQTVVRYSKWSHPGKISHRSSLAYKKVSLVCAFAFFVFDLCPYWSFAFEFAIFTFCFDFFILTYIPFNFLQLNFCEL